MNREWMFKRLLSRSNYISTDSFLIYYMYVDQICVYVCTVYFAFDISMAKTQLFQLKSFLETLLLNFSFYSLAFVGKKLD